MSKYDVLPLINYVRNVKAIFKSKRTCVANIPFVSIYSLYYDTKSNFKMISYDKIGLQYKHLRNASRKFAYVSAAFNYTILTLEQLWSIYFEIYTYIEKLLIYSKEFRKDLIDAIYENASNVCHTYAQFYKCLYGRLYAFHQFQNKIKISFSKEKLCLLYRYRVQTHLLDHFL